MLIAYNSYTNLATVSNPHRGGGIIICVTSQQGVPGDADAVWGTVCPGRSARRPRFFPFFLACRRKRYKNDTCVVTYLFKSGTAMTVELKEADDG